MGPHNEGIMQNYILEVTSMTGTEVGFNIENVVEHSRYLTVDQDLSFDK